MGLWPAEVQGQAEWVCALSTSTQGANSCTCALIQTYRSIRLHTHHKHTHKSRSVHMCTQKRTAMLYPAPGHRGLDSEGYVPALKNQGVFTKPRREGRHYNERLHVRGRKSSNSIRLYTHMHIMYLQPRVHTHAHMQHI